MVRHGQASFGEDNYDRLSELGSLQSKLLAEYFFKAELKFDVVYTGNMVRHLETLQEFKALYNERSLPFPEVKNLEELNEYDSFSIFQEIAPGIIEKDPSLADNEEQMFSDKRSFQNIFEKVMNIWVSDNYSAGDLVRWKDYVASVYRGVEEIMKFHGRGERVAVFTSGGPISVTVRKALNLSDEDTMRVSWQIANSSVTRFKCTRDQIMLSSFNELSHLELYPEDGLITYR